MYRVESGATMARCISFLRRSSIVNGELNPDAAWYYAEPKEAASIIKGYVAFWKDVQVS
jgi:hypothetical protein